MSACQYLAAIMGLVLTATVLRLVPVAVVQGQAPAAAAAAAVRGPALP
jgi:hypothetical protein